MWLFRKSSTFSYLVFIINVAFPITFLLGYYVTQMKMLFLGFFLAAPLFSILTGVSLLYDIRRINLIWLTNLLISAFVLYAFIEFARSTGGEI